MPTNYKRKPVSTEVISGLRITRFDTGSLQVEREDTGKRVFTLSNSTTLNQRYFDELIELLTSDDTIRVQSVFSRGIYLELSRKTEPGVRFILDSNLTKSSKLAYIVAYLSLRFELSDNSIQEVIQSRPDPLQAAKSKGPNVNVEPLIQAAFIPDMFLFSAPVKNEDEYIDYCLRTTFVRQDSNETYGDFLKRMNGKFFTSLEREAMISSPSAAAIPLRYVEDLTPAEYRRFARYFFAHTPSALRTWVRGLFDDGRVSWEETLRSAKDKPTKERLFEDVDPRWRPVLSYLSANEAQDFMAYVRSENGPKKLYRGVEPAAAALVAFYWLEAGEKKLNDLFIHVSESKISEANVDYNGYGLQRFSLNWQNPYAYKRRARPDLLPYLQAIRDPEARELPLEWAIAKMW